jgi:DNA-binding MarR family transcriptional regulator
MIRRARRTVDDVAETHWFDDIVFPALLRGARTTYGGAIRSALVDAGFDDVPRNGAFVIGGIARTGAPLGEVVKDLGSSKQAVGQLIDTLVARGYIDRSVDPDDRRRLTVTLTDRGVAAARAVRSAVEGVDKQLAARVSDRHIANTRATLGALIEIGNERR